MSEERRLPGNRDVGNIIREIRTNILKMNQDQFFSVIGENDQTYVSRIENGHYGLHHRALISLRDFVSKHAPEQLEAVRLMAHHIQEILVPTLDASDDPLIGRPFILSTALISFVRDLYKPFVQEAQGQLVSHENLEYPAAFFPANGATFDAILPPANMDSLREHVVSEATIERDTCPRWTRYKKIGDEEFEDHEGDARKSGWNPVMTHLSMEAGYPVLHAKLATYHQIVDSSDAMLHEIRRAFAEHVWEPSSADEYSSILEHLPLRQRIHHSTENPFLNAQSRAAGIGVVALLCFRRPDGNWATIIEKRSDRVGTYQRALHVVPGGMLGWRFTHNGLPSRNQEEAQHNYQEGDVELAMLSEYAEEVFDNPPPPTTDRRQVRQWAPIYNLMKTHQAKIIPIGVAVDLLNLRPELCALVLIRDPNWWEHEFPKTKLNWEYFDYNTPNWQCNTLSITSDDDGHDLLLPQHTVASCAAAFWHGVKIARQSW